MTCPATEQVGPYLLRCVMPAGHDGEHWASEIEDAESAQTPAVERDSRREMRENRSGPEGALTPESPALTTRQHYLEGADG